MKGVNFNYGVIQQVLIVCDNSATFLLSVYLETSHFRHLTMSTRTVSQPFSSTKTVASMYVYCLEFTFALC